MKKGSTEIELKEVPAFRNEDEEREFWAKTDSSNYVNWEGSEIAVLPDLKPTTRAIS